MIFEDEMTYMTFTDEFGSVERLICPECSNHKQDNIGNVHDCKNLIYSRKRDVAGYFIIVGQCGCCSVSHGIRR